MVDMGLKWGSTTISPVFPCFTHKMKNAMIPPQLNADLEISGANGANIISTNSQTHLNSNKYDAVLPQFKFTYSILLPAPFRNFQNSIAPRLKPHITLRKLRFQLLCNVD